MSCSIRVLTNVDEWMEWSKETLSDPEARKKAVDSNSTQRGSLCMNRRGKLWY